ncbi:hypothetical protein L596_004136 [Steinernema carpocapsae]|uniref:Uncharacterized protein n=1 Tax=Steinernema carpocapsae TaxID=34508 RepID=A0A4U8UUZ5_STECR|nr:hypothetical protein L596_004136 [Steinernema carpocapsae]
MLPGDCLKHPWIVSCRKRATRATEEKPLDTGKLRSYVRNKHFRRLVFGVLFINTVLKMMNAMQERKSENGIAYVKSMYNLAGRKKRDGRDGASPIATTSADISLKTEGHNGVAAASVSNDGTPKVLESIRIEKRTPNLPNLPESTAKVKRKPVETGKTPKCDPKKKAAAAAPKSAPASTESADIAKKSAAAKKKDMGSVDSLVSNALEKISNKAKTSSKLAQPPQANKIPWNSSSKETNETSEKSVAKTAAAVKQIGKTEESMPGKSREDEKNDALKVPSAKNTFASKMANSLEKNAAPLSLPVISVPPRTLPLNPDGNHETKSGATTGAKKVEEKTSDPAILDKTKSVQNVKQKDSKASMPTTLSNGTSTVSTSSVKTQIAAPDQSPPKTVSSTDNNLTVLSKRSGKTSSPCPPMRSDSSQKASAPAKTKCEAKLPVLAKNVDAPKPKDRPASAPNPTNLESTKSILYEVVEKVSQEFVALRVLSKCKLRKVDQLATGPSTPPTGPTPALKPTRKQQQNVAVNAQQAPRTVDALGVSNIKTTISESESFDKQRSQKNTVPITAEKKTTTESKTKVTSKTVKKQTSIRSAGIEENESTEASRCKVKHTTSRKTEEEDVCNTVLENGQLEWSKKNSQKGLVETTSREVKALRGQQELKQKQKIEVIHVNKPKNAKTQVSGSAIEVSKRATFGVVVDKKTPEKPPLGRCTLEVKNDMKVKKLNDGKTETFVVEVSQKKQLTKKPAENGQKTTDRSGFMSDDEPATNLKKSAKKIHKSNDSLFDLEFPIKPLSKKIVTFSKEVLDDKSHSKEQKSGVAGGFGLMKMKSESTLHKKRFSVDVAKSSDDICSSASGKPRASVPTTDVEYSFANLRKQLENRIEEEKSGHMWKSSTELRFTSTNSSNAKRAMNKWLSMEKHLGN